MEKKRIAVLLDGPFAGDGRVQRFTATLAKVYDLDLYYIQPTERDRSLASLGVTLYPQVDLQPKLWQKHLAIGRKFDFLGKAAVDSGRKYDLVMANDYTTLWPACYISQKLNIPLVYDTHEIYMATVNQFYDYKNAPFYKKGIFHILIWLIRMYNRPVERYLVNKYASLVVTVSHSFVEFFSKNFSNKKILLVMNMPRVSDYQVLSDEQELGEMYQKAKKFANHDGYTAIYQGGINKGRGLEQLIEALPQTPSHLKAIIIGHGPLLDILKRRAEQLKLNDRVLFTGKLPRLHLDSYTQLADFGVLFLESFNISKKLTLANKVFEYMASGIPQLLTPQPEHVRIGKETNSIFFSEGSNERQIADSLTNICKVQKAELKQRGQEATKLIGSKYNWDAQEEEIFKSFQGLL